MAGTIYNTIELTGSEYCPSRWDRTTVADGNWLQSNTLEPLRKTDLFLAAVIDDVIDDIDTMKAATDVIAVYGTFSAFSNNSGDLVSTSALTDKDVIKVLNDESKDKKQVYYQWDASGSEWSDIGFLEPYYSTTQIDAMSAEIYDRIDEVEANSISAVEHDSNLTGDGTVTGKLGLNSTVVLSGTGATANYTYSGISLTASDSTTVSAAVEDIIRWNTVTGKLNGAAITGENGISAEYDSTNSMWKVGASADLLGSARSGAAASAWISNTGNYVRHNETSLEIGNTSYLTAVNNATAFGNRVNADTDYSFAAGEHLVAQGKAVALGRYASAYSQSFAFGFGYDESAGSSARAKGVVIGEGNSAYSNTYIIGYNNYGESGTFIYGALNSGTKVTMIGANNSAYNSEGGKIIGDENTVDMTNAKNMVVLGNCCRGNYKEGDLLAVGWGSSLDHRDSMLLSQADLKIFPEYNDRGSQINGVSISPFGTYFPYSHKIYTNNEISGVNVQHNSWSKNDVKSLNQLYFNNLMLNSNVSANNKFAGYIVEPELIEAGTQYHSNSFKIFSNTHQVSFRVGIPDNWTVILKGFNPFNGGYEPSASERNLHYITGSVSAQSWYQETPTQSMDFGTYITAADFVKPNSGVGSNYWYLWINNLYCDQYMDCIVDRASRTFAMFKGGFGGTN